MILKLLLSLHLVESGRTIPILYITTVIPSGQNTKTEKAGTHVGTEFRSQMIFLNKGFSGSRLSEDIKILKKLRTLRFSQKLGKAKQWYHLKALKTTIRISWQLFGLLFLASDFYLIFHRSIFSIRILQ